MNAGDGEPSQQVPQERPARAPIAPGLPPRPPVLNYARPAAREPRFDRGFALQMFAGVALWLVLVVLTISITGDAVGRRGTVAPMLGSVLAVAVVDPVVAIAVGAVMHRKGWRGFMPGVVMGFGLTCLVPVWYVVAQFSRF